LNCVLIDRFLPVYDVVERHEIMIHATAERVYAEVRNLDLTRSKLSRLLFRLRGLPPASHNTLDDVLKMGFILLAEEYDREIVLGVVGRFWKLSGGLRRLGPDEYLSFDQPGYAKGAWNFHLSPAEGGVLLTTETRVRCPDARSRLRFRFYWSLVGPFSGLIRKEMLRIVREQSGQIRARDPGEL
jgi:hypothetical protein